MKRTRLGAGTDAKRTPLVPELTNETWELLEYRLWSKFQTKLWAAVGVFLTLTTLGGVLGARAYINDQVETQLRSERDEILTARKQFQKSFEDALSRAELAGWINAQAARDNRVFQQACDTALKSIAEANLAASITSDARNEAIRELRHLCTLGSFSDGSYERVIRAHFS